MLAVLFVPLTLAIPPTRHAKVVQAVEGLRERRDACEVDAKAITFQRKAARCSPERVRQHIEQQHRAQRVVVAGGLREQRRVDAPLFELGLEASLCDEETLALV